jgi:hypothetical protein
MPFVQHLEKKKIIFTNKVYQMYLPMISSSLISQTSRSVSWLIAGAARLWYRLMGEIRTGGAKTSSIGGTSPSELLEPGDGEGNCSPGVSK